MIRHDSTDIESLVSYIDDTKPFHTKLVDVEVEYQWNEHVDVTLLGEKHYIDLELASIWEYNFIANGVRKVYRIPPVVMPRSSTDIHYCALDPIIDESHDGFTEYLIDGLPRTGVYNLRYNNGAQVTVNGVAYKEGVQYTLDRGRTLLRFNTGYFPSLGADLCVNLYHLDRLFLRQVPFGNPAAPFEVSSVEFTGATTDPGTGTLSNISLNQASAVAESYLIEITDSLGTKFNVRRSSVAPGLTENQTIGIPYTDGNLSFTVNPGVVPFTIGDVFHLTIQSHDWWVPYRILALNADGTQGIPKVGQFDGGLTPDLIGYFDAEPELDVPESTWVVLPFDTEIDKPNHNSSEISLVSSSVNIDGTLNEAPLGTIKRLIDPDTAGDYWVFEFFDESIPANNSQITFRIEERETYNNATHATITEFLDIADEHYLYELLDLVIADPEGEVAIQRGYSIGGLSTYGLDLPSERVINIDRGGFDIIDGFDDYLFDPEFTSNHNSLFDISIEYIDSAINVMISDDDVDQPQGIVQGNPEPIDPARASFAEHIDFDVGYSFYDSFTARFFDGSYRDGFSFGADTNYGEDYDPFVYIPNIAGLVGGYDIPSVAYDAGIYDDPAAAGYSLADLVNNIEIDNYPQINMIAQVRDTATFEITLSSTGATYVQASGQLPTNTNRFIQIEPINVLVLYHGRATPPINVLTYVAGIYMPPTSVEHINNNSTVVITLSGTPKAFETILQF